MNTIKIEREYDGEFFLGETITFSGDGVLVEINRPEETFMEMLFPFLFCKSKEVKISIVDMYGKVLHESIYYDFYSQDLTSYLLSNGNTFLFWGLDGKYTKLVFNMVK